MLLALQDEAVLLRPEHRAAGGASVEQVALLLDALCAVCRPAWRDGHAPGTGLAIMEARMTQANYALRLQASLKAEAERLAKAEGTTLNQFINVAVSEKIATLRTAEFFRERTRRANVPAAVALLDSLGTDEAPREGDEFAGDAGRSR